MLTEIERAAIEGHRQARVLSRPEGLGDSESAVYLGIRLLLDAGRLVRERRETADAAVTTKDDGSPATEIEERIESRLRSWLPEFGSETVLIGEESGGALPAAGTALAIDPIDGTRAFLARTETYSTTLAFIRDGVVVMGMVSNPTTGEIAYATADGGARVVRLAVFGEADDGGPLGHHSPGAPTLVNFHPSSDAVPVVEALHRAWARREIAMVRSPGGSPAWALVEAARGHFVYANLWPGRRAKAFDLAAAVLIVRRAGGEVTHLDGAPIDPLRHSGPFVAGLDPMKSARLASLLVEGLGAGARTQA